MKNLLKVTFGFLLSLCFMLVGGVGVTYAAEVEASEESQEKFIYTTASELGLPTTLDAELDLSSYGTANEINVNGFKYTITSSSDVTVEITEEAANMDTIYLTLDLGTWNIYNSIYNSLDFTPFANAKNLVLDTTVNLSAMYNIIGNTNVENIFVAEDNDLPLIPSSTKVKNIVFCYGYGWLDGNKWNNSNVNLSNLPNAKIVTIDSNKYAIINSIDSYKENSHYTEGEHYPLYVIEDDDFPYDETILTKGSYVEFGGAIYTLSRTNIDMFPKYGIAHIDDIVTKIIVDPTEFTEYRGGFTEYAHKLDTVYLKEGGENSQISTLKATNLIAPIPEEFVYSDYVNFDNVYFYTTETLDTLLIGPDSITADETVNVKFYLDSEASYLNQSENATITAKISKVDSMPEAVVEIEVDAKTVETSDPKTKVSTLLAQLEEEENEDNSNDGTNSGNTDNSNDSTGGNNDETNDGNDTTDDKTDDNKDENTDKNDQTAGDEIKDTIDDFKEQLKENKALQAVTAVASVLLAFVVGYLLYVLVRKIIRWVK